MTLLRRLCMAVLVLGLPLAAAEPAASHRQSLGSLTARIDDSGREAQVAGRIDLGVADVDRLADLDRDGDGRITWGEIAARETDIAARLVDGVGIGGAGGACRIGPGPLALDARAGETTLVLPFAGTCPALGGRIEARYDLFFAVDAQHRGVIDIRQGERALTAVATPVARTASLGAGDDGVAAVAADFFLHGLHHILIGVDHILFVITLLLSAALERRDGRWRPTGSVRSVVVAVVKLVTAFTAAHSLTLALAALRIVVLPAALVESVIALSIVVAAANLVWPVFSRRLWVLVFGFGLMHGFGFAGVLADLGLPAGREAVALVAFNLGVEAGQLAIVALALPALVVARQSAAFGRLAMPAAAASIALVATAWLVERSLGLDLLSAFG